MAVEALVAITYDWLVDGAGWKLVLGRGEASRSTAEVVQPVRKMKTRRPDR